jgi:TPR repeat protein
MNRFLLGILMLVMFIHNAEACIDVNIQDTRNFSKCQKLAEQGDSVSQYQLGLMYQMGKGVSQDYHKTFHWWSMAADQGNATAQHRLGYMYIQGYGVAQDYVMSHLWFNLATLNGDGSAAENREIVAARMNRSQIKQALSLANKWIAQH